MQFKIRLVTAPGDKKVERAQVRVINEDGKPVEGQVILEGETIETGVSLAEGQRIEVSELERPVVYNPETKGAEYADLTPKDPLAPKPPPTEATPKADPKPDPKVHK